MCTSNTFLHTLYHNSNPQNYHKTNLIKNKYWLNIPNRFYLQCCKTHLDLHSRHSYICSNNFTDLFHLCQTSETTAESAVPQNVKPGESIGRLCKNTNKHAQRSCFWWHCWGTGSAPGRHYFNTLYHFTECQKESADMLCRPCHAVWQPILKSERANEEEFGDSRDAVYEINVMTTLDNQCN